jgi:Lsr2
MSQKVHSFLVDDLDGSAAEARIRFGFDGTDYEIDLNDAHLTRLRQTLDKYISAGRKVTERSRRTHRSMGGAPSDGPTSLEVRRWARSQGMDVKDRGRLPAGMRAKFIAAAGS